MTINIYIYICTLRVSTCVPLNYVHNSGIQGSLLDDELGECKLLTNEVLIFVYMKEMTI